MAAEPTGLAIRVGEGGNRDDLVVGSGNPRRGAPGVVACRRDDGNAAAHEPADRRVKDVVRGRTARRVILSVLRDTHVDRFEQRPARIVRIALGGDPVEPADVPAEEAFARVVEDLDGPQAHARRDADHAAPVVDRTDRAGDVRAVAVHVAPSRAIGRRAVVTTDDVEVGDRRDAGIDDRDVGIDPLVDPIDRGHCRSQGADPADPGRHRLGLGLDPLVGDDHRHRRIVAQRGDLRAVQDGGVAAHGVAVRPIGGEPDPLPLATDRGADVGTGLQHDDPAIRRIRG